MDGRLNEEILFRVTSIPQSIQTPAEEEFNGSRPVFPRSRIAASC